MTAPIATLEILPSFRIGQIWAPRTPRGRKDVWKIVAITDHPQSPVIAQCPLGTVRDYGMNGAFGGEDEMEPESDLDLVTLIQ